MTLLGKIFTMLIFILSLMCMFFAVAVYMSDKNWKDVVVNTTEAEGKPLGLKPQLDQKNKEIERLNEQLGKLKEEYHREIASRAGAIASLETALRVEIAKRQMAVKTHDDLLTAHAEAQAAVKLQEERLKALTAEVADARLSIKSAQEDRDNKLERVVFLTDELNKAQDLKQRLEERQRELVAQIARMENVLKSYNLNEFDDVDGIPPPLTGLVTAVQQTLVEISLGSDDGLKEGHQLDVSDGNTYKGRIKVLQTFPDKSVAEIIPALRKGEIQKGNYVRTRTTSIRSIGSRPTERSTR